MLRPLGFAAFAAAAVLSGCSSGGHGTSGLSAQELAGRVGCTGYQPHSDVIGVRDEGTCKLGGAELTITTFHSSGEQRTVTAAFGSLDDGVPVVGPLWRVGTPDAATARQVQAKLGGRTG